MAHKRVPSPFETLGFAKLLRVRREIPPNPQPLTLRSQAELGVSKGEGRAELISAAAIWSAASTERSA